MFKKKNYGTEDMLEGAPETAVRVKKPKKKKKGLIALIIVVVLVVFLLVRASMAGNSVPMVETVRAEKGTVTQELSTNGIITAVNSTTYASPVNAKVSEVKVKTGDTVAAGDDILIYDTASLEESYSLADLQAKSAMATNNDSLNKSSQYQTDKANAENTLNTLQGQIDTKNVQIQTTQNDIMNTTITSNNLTASISAMQTEITSLSAKVETGTATAEEAAKLAQDQTDLKNLQAQATELTNTLTTQQAVLASQQAELSDLQTQKSKAESEKSTAEAGILSENQKASLTYNNEVSKLNVTSAENELEKAQTGIKADAAGIVTEVDITDGAVAAEGMALVAVADTSDIKIDIQVSKYDMERLEIGQEAVITALGNTYEGTVESISRMATTGSSGAKMVDATVSIDNPDDRLVLGLDAKVQICLGTAEDVLLVPLTAVNTDTEGSFVYAVENYTIVRKTVTTGLTSNSTVEITEGLEEGAEVIDVVDASIVEGTVVTTTLQMEAAASAAGESASGTEAE